MRRFVTLLVVAALALAVLPVGSAAGDSPPLDVFFEVETTLPPDGPAFGPFAASGPAVDEGLICASGDTVDVGGRFSGFNPPGTGFNIQVFKLFTCDDGSGDFVLRLQVRVDRNGVNFSWVGVLATGELEDLQYGSGHGVGIPGVPCGDPDACVLDLFEGKVK